MSYPVTRMRRLRRSEAIRRLVRETKVGIDDLIMPVFVKEGISETKPIVSIPGVMIHSAASVEDEVASCLDLGLPGVMLFGIPETKDNLGSSAYRDDNIISSVAKRLKAKYGDRILIMADLCLDEYTDHGHCGILASDSTVINDETLSYYGKIAVAYALAGIDFVAPSGMMDGQVAAIRSALDNAGHKDTAILAYSAKYASAFYGPFRDAVEVTIAGGGDRKTYQQDVANADESIREIALDIDEGADMVMVKPAMTSLDIIARAKSKFNFPLAAYQVSGEYSMICTAADNNMLDRRSAVLESLTVIKRAGADCIITYFAKEAAQYVNGGLSSL